MTSLTLEIPNLLCIISQLDWNINWRSYIGDLLLQHQYLNRRPRRSYDNSPTTNYIWTEREPFHPKQNITDKPSLLFVVFNSNLSIFDSWHQDRRRLLLFFLFSPLNEFLLQKWTYHTWERRTTCTRTNERDI